MKDIALYIVAILLGTSLVMIATWICGFEEAVIYSIGFILGKLLLQDIKRRD
jgi:hypothetical protein